MRSRAVAVCRYAVGASLFLTFLAGCPPRAKESGRKSAQVPWIPRRASWADGEVSSYDVLRNDTIDGKTVFRFRQAVDHNQPVWEITGVNTAFQNEFALLHDSISALLTRDSLKPVRTFQVRNLMARQDTVTTRYEKDRVIVVANAGKTDTLAAPNNTFDNSILLMVIRTLDLQPGAKFLLTSVAAFGPWTKPTDIEVQGEETVTVPAGQFVCCRVALQIAGYTLYLWYEKAAPHRYVRFENRTNGSTAVLTKYEVLSH
jgi:hypothetical protein